MRAVLLNALPLNALPSRPLHLLIEPVPAGQLRLWIKLFDEVVSYIRHPATVELLKQLLGIDIRPSAELYQWRQGDVMFVVTLKRPARGQEAAQVSLEDLDIRKVVAVEY